MSHPVGLGHRACPWPYQSCSCDFQNYIPPQEKTMSNDYDQREMLAKRELEGLKKAAIERGNVGDPKHRYAVPILRHFKHDHLPPRLASVSYDFCELANRIVSNIQNGPERQVALRKLLEAKDAAVRAVMEES